MVAACSAKDETHDTPNQPMTVQAPDEISPPGYKPNWPPLPVGVNIALDCMPISARNDWGSEAIFKNRDWCGSADEYGHITIDPDVMKLIDFTVASLKFLRHSEKLQCHTLNLSNGESSGGYIRQDGRARQAPEPFDAECQALTNGRFHSYVKGKAAYFDEDLHVVYRTKYVHVSAFSGGYAIACLRRPERRYKSDGEHFDFIGGQCGFIGGQCGFIDETYSVVVPIAHPYELTPLPQNTRKISP